MNLQVKRPREGNWQRLFTPGFRHQLALELKGQPEMPPSEMFVSPLGIQVITSIHVVENANKVGKSPHFHISISDRGERVPASIVPVILKQFGAEDFEEDNHSPMRKIRSFWRPVDGAPTECACKETEKPEIDGDYTWRPA